MNRCQAIFSVCIIGVAASATDAQTPYDLIQQANAQLERGDAQQALQGYEQAATALPEAVDELAYNRAVAHYRLGEMDTARSLFEQSLATRDPQLAARSQFNLGNINYAAALQAEQAPPEQKLALLDEAIDHYRRSLDAMPTDIDARANIELAERLKRQIQEQQQQRDQQDQQQDQQQQDQEQQQQSQQNQDPSESSEQSESDPSEPEQSSDNTEQSQSKEQGQDGESQDSAQPQPSGDASDTPESSEMSGEQDASPAEPQDVPEGQLKPGQEQADSQQDTGETQGQPRPGEEAKPLSEDEARKLLQAIRDRDLQRRAQQNAREAAGQAPVEKDW